LIKKANSTPNFFFEYELSATGVRKIAGVDEAGRGPLAGSVLAAAVMFDFRALKNSDLLAGLNDSKKLSKKKRYELFEIIIANGDVGIASANPVIIERLNIRGASLYAMKKAVLALPNKPDHVLIDGNAIPDALAMPASAIVKGDSKSLSIAAASIVAKVMRDEMCKNMDIDFPEYGFAKHKAYGTKIHMEALSDFGVTDHHRVGFAPVAKLLEKN